MIGLAIMMVLLAAVPSASVALVVTRAAAHGVASGIAVACGIVAGDLVFLGLAYAGMSALAEATGAFFMVIKYLGGAYLIGLGIALLRSRPASREGPPPPPGGANLALSALAGLLLTLGDVKAILFYASLLPLVWTPGEPGAASLSALACLTVLSVGGVKVVYAFLAARLARKVVSPRAQRLSSKVAGGVLIGTGSCLILKS